MYQNKDKLRSIEEPCEFIKLENWRKNLAY